jgi:hypothetical protein
MMSSVLHSGNYVVHISLEKIRMHIDEVDEDDPIVRFVDTDSTDERGLATHLIGYTLKKFHIPEIGSEVILDFEEPLVRVYGVVKSVLCGYDKDGLYGVTVKLTNVEHHESD